MTIDTEVLQRVSYELDNELMKIIVDVWIKSFSHRHTSIIQKLSGYDIIEKLPVLKTDLAKQLVY